MREAESSGATEKSKQQAVVPSLSGSVRRGKRRSSAAQKTHRGVSEAVDEDGAVDIAAGLLVLAVRLRVVETWR